MDISLLFPLLILLLFIPIFSGDGIAKGNPILCCTPGLTRELEQITGIMSRHKSN
jgi:hypothetical protein